MCPLCNRCRRTFKYAHHVQQHLAGLCGANTPNRSALVPMGVPVSMTGTAPPCSVGTPGSDTVVAKGDGQARRGRKRFECPPSSNSAPRVKRQLFAAPLNNPDVVVGAALTASACRIATPSTTTMVAANSTGRKHFKRSSSSVSTTRAKRPLLNASSSNPITMDSIPNGSAPSLGARWWSRQLPASRDSNVQFGSPP